QREPWAGKGLRDVGDGSRQGTEFQALSFKRNSAHTVPFLKGKRTLNDGSFGQTFKFNPIEDNNEEWQHEKMKDHTSYG
ncbi:unnamed protein product, partial [Dovyalis caffra]